MTVIYIYIYVCAAVQWFGTCSFFGKKNGLKIYDVIRSPTSDGREKENGLQTSFETNDTTNIIIHGEDANVLCCCRKTDPRIIFGRWLNF